MYVTCDLFIKLSYFFVFVVYSTKQIINRASAPFSHTHGRLLGNEATTVKMVQIKSLCFCFGLILMLSAATQAHMNLYLNQQEVMRLLGK